MVTHSDLVEVRQILRLPDHFEQFLTEAAAEGFDHMSALQEGLGDGTNRFNRPGELLALATINGENAGIGGITHDFVDPNWLRMRRFYVRSEYRRRGVGRKIAAFILAHAKPFNCDIALYAGSPQAEVFWPTLGFQLVEREKTTHALFSDAGSQMMRSR